MPLMDAVKAGQLAMQLMEQHGLLAQGWRFAWGHGRRQLGSASIRRRVDRGTGRVQQIKTITLSRYLVALNGEDAVRDTILHEIAHALAGLDHGHDDVWKAVCRRIGAEPQRLAGEDIQLAPARYQITCTHCQRSLGTRQRRMNPDRLSQCYCRHCGKASKGHLTEQINPALKNQHPDRVRVAET